MVTVSCRDKARARTRAQSVCSRHVSGKEGTVRFINFLNSESESDACNTGNTSSPKPRFGNENGVNIQGKLIVGDEINN